MKILTLCYEYPPIGGGGGKVVAGLTQELARQGEQVDVLTMHYDHLPYRRIIQGVQVFSAPCIRLHKEICTPFEMLTYLITAFPIALKLIQQNKYELIHAHFIFPDGVLANFLKKITGIPYILTAHGSDVPGYNPHRFQLEHRLLLPLWKRIVQESAFTVTASDRLADLIHQYLPHQPIQRIYNAFSPPLLSNKPKNPLHILTVTRLFERKGIQYLIQALDGVTTPYQVDIIGAGPYQSALESLARSIHTNAKITFHGWIDHQDPRFWELMETAAIFVFPSEEENFPMVLLEAMAAQMAIITTNNSGCAEVVGDAG
ncbi:MAG: glycosyltransferase, partial [Anaerolineales bacterium]